jgi:hypothetical protein
MGRHSWLDCVFIGLAAGAAGGIMGYLLKFGFDATAVFGFFGSLAGAAVTVFGAISYSNLEKRREHRAEVDILYEELLPLVHNLNEIARIWPKQVGRFEPEFRKLVARAGSDAFNAAGSLEEALKYARTLNFQQRSKLRRCQETVQEFVRYYEDETASTADDPFDGYGLNWYLKVQQVIGFIRLLFASLNKEIPKSSGMETAPLPKAEMLENKI